MDEYARVPPHDIQAETCVLGSMMLDSRCIDEMMQCLQPDHFYRPAHGMIFQCLADMRTASKAVDLVLVKDELDGRGELEKVGGIEYVAELVSGVPDTANARYYADIVKNKHLLRRLIQEAGRIAQTAWTADSAEDNPRAAASTKNWRRRAGNWLSKTFKGASRTQTSLDAQAEANQRQINEIFG